MRLKLDKKETCRTAKEEMCMEWSIRDTRHVVLIALIVAALPMLIYPNDFGVTFQMSMFWYTLLELTYYFSVGLILNRRRSVAYTAIAAVLTLTSRLVLSAAFLLMLMVLEQMPTSQALTNAFDIFKPAILLFSVTAPFLFNSTIQMMLPGRVGRRHLRKSGAAPILPSLGSGRPRPPHPPLRLRNGRAASFSTTRLPVRCNTLAIIRVFCARC
jgi:hypothetical protein